MKNNKNNKSLVFVLVLLVLAGVAVFFFPKINEFLTKITMPKVEKTETREEEEKRVIDEDIIETIHYPLMRTSIYNTNTYYSLDTFKISDMSNTDILLNGFLSIENVMIKSTGRRGTCVVDSVAFDTKWIDFRIKNILGKTVNYYFEDFYVPEDRHGSYSGNWTYNSATNQFIYNGLCRSLATTPSYHDLTKLIKLDYADKESNDIIAIYYIGFAKVEGNSYSMYSDTNMTNLVTSGDIEDINKINEIFENLDATTLNKFNKYQYTFKDNLCSYNDYCLYEGKWLNE